MAYMLYAICIWVFFNVESSGKKLSVGTQKIYYLKITDKRNSVCVIMIGMLIINHYNDVKMGPMASQITSLTIVYSAVDSGAD